MESEIPLAPLSGRTEEKAPESTAPVTTEVTEVTDDGDFKRGTRFWLSFVALMVSIFIAALELVSEIYDIVCHF